MRADTRFRYYLYPYPIITRAALEKGGQKFEDISRALCSKCGIKDETFEEYVERCAVFYTYAAIDSKSWHGPKTMSTRSMGVWRATLAERFLSNHTDKTIIATIDCHSARYRV